MSGLMKLLGAIEVFREAFDDSKHPTFSASSTDDEEFRVNDHDSRKGDGCFYRSSPSSSYGSSSYSGSSSNWSRCEEDDGCAEDDSHDATIDTVVTCIRIGRIMRLVDRGNYIAACKR